MSHHIKNYDPPLVTAKFYILLVGKRVQVGECGWYKSESVGGHYAKFEPLQIVDLEERFGKVAALWIIYYKVT